jgi:ABC-type oligopeptide transport system ATPase subunit
MFVSRLNGLTETVDIKVTSLNELSVFTIKYDWSPFLFNNNYRHGNNWSRCDVFAIDIDEGCTIERAKELFKEYTYAILTSKSHQIEKNDKIVDRFRIIIPLSSSIMDREIYKNTWYSLSNKFPFIDQQCKDFARFYYKSKELIHINNGKTLDPVTENVMPNILQAPQLELKLTKGKLSRGTMEFIVEGAQSGKRNISAYKAAKDFQEQGYTIDEAYERLIKSPCIDDEFTENELQRTIESAYTNDPKYDPRGLSEKQEYVAMSISDLEKDASLYVKNEAINGPSFWDCTEERWRKGEVLGVVAGSGTGKSSVSLKIIKDIIMNNRKSNDDIHFFFSLEMPARQIVQRWQKLVGKDHPDGKRLFVIDNKNTDERLTWQHIYKFVQDTCKSLNKKPGCVVIDHFMALSDKIDTTKEPNFDVSTDVNSGRGKVKTISVKEMCRLMKVIAEDLNCFLIIQNQSTIERAGHGDTPMGINAAYGAAQFAWFCDYIITVWQPLKRVQAETPLTASGWQYSKIREVGLNDATRVYTRHSIFYDIMNGDFRPLTEIEQDEFNKFVERANALRKADEKKETTQYQNSPREKFQQLLSLVESKKND